MEWQPIETAPKDRRILVATATSGINAVEWQPSQQAWCVYAWDDWGRCEIDDCTHWMPLPEPPQGGS